MITVRFLRLLRWFGLTVLRPLGLKDRWGFNLGEDLDDWAMMRMFVYLLRVEKATRFERVGTTGPPPSRMRTVGCEHVTIAGPLAPGTVNAWCGCVMHEIVGNTGALA